MENDMDILGTLQSALGDENKGNDLLGSVMNLIGGQNGLSALVQQFTSNGLGDVVSSWIGSGNNMPVSSEQIQSTLGSETVKNLASKLGMDSNSFAGQLSNMLPDVVDKLTPDGKMPEGDILSKGMDLLGGLLEKK